jgi:TonB family protein
MQSADAAQPAAAPQPVAAAQPVATPADAPKDTAVSFDQQLERATTNSKVTFDRCAADAGSPHGTVRVAFRVLEDGSVANAFPVEDSTGSPSLGQCLAQTITAWRFTPDPTRRAPINSLRAFNYP